MARIQINREEQKKMHLSRKAEVNLGQFDNATATSISMPASMGVGIAGTVLWYLLLLPFKGSLLFDMFYARGWVPFVLVFLVSWSFAMLALKWLKVRKQREAMFFNLLPHGISEKITVEHCEAFREHILGLRVDPNGNFLINRILRGLSHFQVRGRHNDTANMLSSQSEIDATTVESSYSIIRVFIWAIPILGFIGTVIGISDAVASFAGELADAQDISVLKDKLGSVTSGLGVAFDTTLIALVMSLIVMFPTSVMQKVEEDFLNQVDEYCNEMLLKRIEDHGASNEGEGGNASAVMHRMEQLQDRIVELQENQVHLFEQMTAVLEVGEEEDEG